MESSKKQNRIPDRNFAGSELDSAWFTFHRARHSVTVGSGTRLHWNNPVEPCFITLSIRPDVVYMQPNILGAVVFLSMPSDAVPGKGFTVKGKPFLELLVDLEAAGCIDNDGAIELREAVKECLTAQAVDAPADPKPAPVAPGG